LENDISFQMWRFLYIVLQSVI